MSVEAESEAQEEGAKWVEGLMEIVGLEVTAKKRRNVTIIKKRLKTFYICAVFTFH